MAVSHGSTQEGNQQPEGEFPRKLPFHVQIHCSSYSPTSPNSRLSFLTQGGVTGHHDIAWGIVNAGKYRRGYCCGPFTPMPDRLSPHPKKKITPSLKSSVTPALLRYYDSDL